MNSISRVSFYGTNYELLGIERMILLEEIPDTTQEYVFANGKISQVLHKRGGATLRTDMYTFGNGTITEARTLSTGETLTITTDLQTLETTITYSES